MYASLLRVSLSKANWSLLIISVGVVFQISVTRTVECYSRGSNAQIKSIQICTLSFCFLMYAHIWQRTPYRFAETQFPDSVDSTPHPCHWDFLKLKALSKQRWLENPRDRAERDRQRQRSPWAGRRTYIACGFSVQLVSDVSALYCTGSTAKARLSQLVVLTVLAGKYVIH